jgi:hypothetical protein
VVGRSTCPTFDYWLDVAHADHPYETSWLLHGLKTGAGVAASGFNEVTDLDFLLSQSVGLLLGDELQRVVIPSVTVCDAIRETGTPCSTRLWTILTCALRQATVR